MEEDITTLETLKEIYIKASECGLGYPSDNREDKSIAQALENLLTRYKQLEAELESVKEIYYTQKEMEDVMIRYRKLVENSIPKSKAKEKIEELKQEDLEIYDTDSEDVRIAKYEQRAVLDALQELLREE